MLHIQELKQDVQPLAFAYSTDSTSVDVSNAKGFGLLLDITNSAPAAATFTAAVTDICTAAGHGFLTGLKVQVSSTTTLPAGLSGSTDYFVIKLTADTFKLASSLVNAQAGTAINITDTGTGTHTVTPTALAGGTYTVQVSMDDLVWINLAAAANITATAKVLIEKVDPMYKFMKVVYVLTAGQLSIVQTTLVKG